MALCKYWSWPFERALHCIAALIIATPSLSLALPHSPSHSLRYAENFTYPNPNGSYLNPEDFNDAWAAGTSVPVATCASCPGYGVQTLAVQESGTGQSTSVADYEAISVTSGDFLSSPSGSWRLGNTTLQAQDVVITASTLSGLNIGAAPGGATVPALAFASTATPPSASGNNATAATWIIAANDQGTLKMVELRIQVSAQGEAYTYVTSARLVTCPYVHPVHVEVLHGRSVDYSQETNTYILIGALSHRHQSLVFTLIDQDRSTHMPMP